MNNKENESPRRSDSYITEEDLQEFIALWKQEFGETLTLEEARLAARELLDLYWVLMRELDGKDERAA